MKKMLALGLLIAAGPALAQNVKVSALPAASALTGTEKIAASQGSNCTTTGTPSCTTVSVSPVQLETYVVGGAWASYTPSITCGSGTITSASTSGNYRQLGKIVFVQMTATITTNGTCAGQFNMTLPVTAMGSVTFYGVESQVTGKMLKGLTFPTLVSATVYDNTYPGADGAVIRLSGTYRVP